MKVCNLQFVVLLFLVAPLLKCFQTPLCYPFLYLRTRLRNASHADYWDTWKWNYNIRDSWFVIFVVCESCLGPPSPPPSLYDPLHSTSWLNWQTNNNQGCALRAPGHLRRLTFGLGRLKIFLGRQPGDLLVLFSWFTVKKQKENVVQSRTHWYSKVIPREFTCNIIIDFDRDKLHSFRF